MGITMKIGELVDLSGIKSNVPEDTVKRVIYGKEDGRYRIEYKSGYTKVTRHPEKKVISALKDEGILCYRDTVYVKRSKS